MDYDPRAKQIGENFFECKYHSTKLLFSQSIVLLFLIQRLNLIINGGKDFIPSRPQYHTKRNPNSITNHLKLLTPISENNNGRAHQLLLLLSKCLLTGLIKKNYIPYQVICREDVQFWEILNKIPVKACMSHRTSHTCYRDGWGKPLYRFNFRLINLYALFWDVLPSTILFSA